MALSLGVARADEPLRPKAIADFPSVSVQEAVRVEGARVSYANFVALRRDFPKLRSLSDKQITQWVLDNFAYISREQLKLNGIRNSAIPHDSEQTKEDFRISKYRRAGLLEAVYHGEEIGVVDIKGLGHLDGGANKQVEEFESAKGDTALIDALRRRGHSDGLMRHGEAIAEVTRQMAIQRLYDIHNAKHGTDLQTVESYFVIELPFDVLGPNGHRNRAALYGRQAHLRGENNRSTPDSIFIDPFGGKQASVSGASVDFGGAILTHPLLKSLFGMPEGAQESDPQSSKAWAKAHEVGRAFEWGNPSAVYEHVDEMLKPIAHLWPGPSANQTPNSKNRLWFELFSGVQSSQISDARLLDLVRFLSETAIDTVSVRSLIRNSFLRNASTARLLEAIEHIPGLINYLSPALDLDLIAKLARARDPRARSLALDKINGFVSRSVPPKSFLKSLATLKREFPTREPVFLAWANQSLHSWLDDSSQISRRELAKGLEWIIATFSRDLKSESIRTRRAAAALYFQMDAAGKLPSGAMSGRLSAAEIFLESARAELLEPAQRFDAVNKYSFLRELLPKDAALPSPAELRQEVHTPFLDALTDSTSVMQLRAAHRRLVKEGMIDLRLNVARMRVLQADVEAVNSPYFNRLEAWRAYRDLATKTPLTDGLPAVLTLAHPLIEDRLQIIRQRTVPEHKHAFDSLRNVFDLPPSTLSAEADVTLEDRIAEVRAQAGIPESSRQRWFGGCRRTLEVLSALFGAGKR